MLLKRVMQLNECRLYEAGSAGMSPVAVGDRELCPVDLRSGRSHSMRLMVSTPGAMALTASVHSSTVRLRLKLP